MKTIVFLGTNKAGSSRDAIKAAKSMGYYTCLFTNREDQLKQRYDYFDVDLMRYVDLSKKEEIRKQIDRLNRLNVAAIVSFIDPWCETAAILSQEYGFRSFTVSAISNSLDKVKTHEILKDTTYAPKYDLLSNIDDTKLTEYLPIVLKASNSQGSKDVYLCKTKEDLDSALEQLNKYSKEEIIVEEFLDGPQYLVETFTINEEVNIVAILHQDIENFYNHFIITGYQLILDRDTPFIKKLEDDVVAIIKQLGFINGSCHLEMRYVNDKWKLVEANPRISGSGMNQIIKAGLGIDFVKEILKYSLNKEVNLLPKYRYPTYAKHKTVSKAGKLKRITGKVRAMESPGVKYVYIKPKKGSNLVPPTSLGCRYAYVVATGKNDAMAKSNAIKALEYIKFHTE